MMIWYGYSLFKKKLISLIYIKNVFDLKVIITRTVNHTFKTLLFISER